jgi:hypothetical protein
MRGKIERERGEEGLEEGRGGRLIEEIHGPEGGRCLQAAK